MSTENDKSLLGSAVQAWLRLFRVPNLFTVPGDALAGLIIAFPWGWSEPPFRALPCMLASLCLYGFGLITNDLADLREDFRERPERPLPSGEIRPKHALAAAVALGLAGLGFGFVAGLWAGLVAVVLAVTIVVYNLWGKRVAVWGPINMGMCRGLSLLLGAAAAERWEGTTAAVVISALGLTLYVAAVTQIARRETVAGPVGAMRWAPGIILLTWFALFQMVAPWEGVGARMLSGGVALAAIAWAVMCARSIAGMVESKTISAAIGGYLVGLLLVQATLVTVMFYAGAVLTAVLVLMMATSSVLAKRFYAS